MGEGSTTTATVRWWWALQTIVVATNHGGCHGYTVVEPFPPVARFSLRPFPFILFGQLSNAISVIKASFSSMKEDLYYHFIIHAHLD